ncbi:MAG: ornithine carbamoyltransferase, partial [Terriglobales bacterium]
MAMKTNRLNPSLGNGGRPPYGTVAPRLPRLGTGDLINLRDLTRKEFFALLDLAADLKVHPGRYRDLLSGCGLAMIFEKPSLRTRVTFDVAMQEMGGHAVFLDFTESPLGEREDIVDVARNLELWMDAIVARTFGHESIELLAEASAVPVINGLSDLSHPCQAMADFLTLREAFEEFPRIKLAYIGDGNNTLHSLLEAAALAGMHLAAAIPKGYEPDAGVVERAQRLAKRSGAKLEIGHRIPPA